jgi:acyl-CoA thioesterase-1
VRLIVMAQQHGTFKIAAGVWRLRRSLSAALALAIITAVSATGASPAGAAPAAPLTLVVLGDSLSAGLGLKAADAFPAQLETALAANHAVTVVNAGVSGDTATDGLARLDWSIGPEANAVIIELGANDALRGIDPAATRAALDAILARLEARHLPVLLTGMLAPPNMGDSYAASFNAIFPDLAKSHNVPLYPFFLDGVATDPKLEQGDGIHPNAAGVAVIVRRILPAVEALVAEASVAR